MVPRLKGIKRIRLFKRTLPLWVGPSQKHVVPSIPIGWYTSVLQLPARSLDTTAVTFSAYEGPKTVLRRPISAASTSPILSAPPPSHPMGQELCKGLLQATRGMNDLWPMEVSSGTVQTTRFISPAVLQLEMPIRATPLSIGSAHPAFLLVLTQPTSATATRIKMPVAHISSSLAARRSTSACPLLTVAGGGISPSTASSPRTSSSMTRTPRLVSGLLLTFDASIGQCTTFFIRQVDAVTRQVRPVHARSGRFLFAVAVPPIGLVILTSMLSACLILTIREGFKISLI